MHYFLALFLSVAGAAYADGMTPKLALEKMLEGNHRFLNDKLICPERTSERRLSIQQKQKPFAVVLGCSDSRIPPEIVFDQGLGDLFVVRVAGNVVSDVELDSILYSVVVNGSCLIMVLGHENCGAIDAVLKNQAGAVPAVAKLIENAIGTKSTNLAEAIKRNVIYSVEKLREIPTFKELIKQGKLEIHGAFYHFETGAVDILN